MKRGWLTLVSGLVAGVAAYGLYFKTHQPCAEETLECELTWIQDYLSLTPEQFDVVVAMHKDRESEIQQLQQQIRYLENRMADLEVERIQNDRIDFIAFYNYLQDKVDLDKSYDSSTQSFLAEVGSVMNTDQKKRFNQLIQNFKSSALDGS